MEIGGPLPRSRNVGCPETSRPAPASLMPRLTPTTRILPSASLMPPPLALQCGLESLPPDVYAVQGLENAAERRSHVKPAHLVPPVRLHLAPARVTCVGREYGDSPEEVHYATDGRMQLLRLPILDPRTVLQAGAQRVQQTQSPLGWTSRQGYTHAETAPHRRRRTDSRRRRRPPL